MFGVNKRLGNVLQEAAEKQKAKEDAEKEKETKPEEEAPPVNMKGLEGLPPALVKKILEKEKAKQMKKMTETTEDKKGLQVLEDLQTVS